MRRLPGKYVALGLGVIVAWGGFLRFWGLGDRPFWCDEAWVATAARDGSYGALLRQTDLPLPPLFAVATKFVGGFGGWPECAYRVLPALAGTLLLPLVYLALRVLRWPRGLALGGAGLCASGMMLLVAARQLKQYSLEALLAVLMALLAFQARRCRSPGRRWSVGIGIVLVCLLGPWFGYGAVFPLSALSLMLIVLKPRQGPRRASVAIGVAGLLALGISVGALVKLSAGGQASDASLAEYARPYYVQPLDRSSWARAAGRAALCTAILFFPVEWFAGLAPASRGVLIWGAAILVWGLALLGLRFWPRRARHEMAWWVCVPPLAMLAAAVLHRYPFALTRMMPYWAPALVVAVAAGVVTLWRGLWILLAGRGGPALLSAVLLGALPAAYAIRVPLEQRYTPFHDIPRLLEVLAQQRRPGETVIVDTTAVPTVRYYGAGLPGPVLFAPVTAGVVPVGGRDDPAWIRKPLRRAGRRWWLLTTGAQGWGRYEGMLAILRQEGLSVSLVERGGLADRSQWAAELLLVTRRYQPAAKVRPGCGTGFCGGLPVDHVGGG